MKKGTPFTKFILPNGLTVIHYKMDSVMSAFAVLYVRVGAIYEKPEERGISHFTEHAAFLGTQKYKSPLAIAEFEENLGALRNGRTSRLRTLYWIKLPSTNIEHAIDLLYEYTFRPLLEEKTVRSEKDVILSEFNDFWHQPDKRYHHEFFKRRFKQKDHPYSYHAIGIPETIATFNKQKVFAWKEKYYHPKNMILIVTGNLDLKTLEKSLNSNFAKELPGQKIPEPKFSTDDYSNFLIYKHEDPRPQISFTLSFPTFGSKEVRRQDRLKLNTLNHITGRGWASRLYQRLRKKERFVYDIKSYSNLLRWMGELYIVGSTPSEKLIPALIAIKEEIDRLAKEGIYKKELESAKNLMNANTLMQFDNPETVAYFLGNQEFDNEEIWFPEDYIREARKITEEDLDKMAREIFDYSRVNLGLMGNIPAKTLKEIEKIFIK